MERFFDGIDLENSKTPGAKGQIRKIEKENKKERVEQRKTRIFDGYGGSHTRVFSIGREGPWATTLVRPSLRRTHSYGNSHTNKQVCPSSV
jgi:hypothetical protein